MEETLSFAPLLLVVLLAFIVPIILKRIRFLQIPIVVGEILAGIIVGRSGLGIVQHHDMVLDLLAEFGFVFLMFLSGMEIDFSSIGSTRSNPSRGDNSRWGPFPLGMLSFALTLGMSALIGFGMVQFDLVSDPWMMALILSTTSLGVVVPVLKERGLSNGRYGQTLLVAALIADFVTMLLITVVVAVLSHGLTLDILLIGILFVAFFLMYRFGLFFFNRIPAVSAIMEELSSATSQIKMRLAFTLMLMFVVLSETLGTEIILGAFLAGAIVSLLRRPEDAELTHQLEAVGFGFFIPIFFIMVGVDFNLNALLSSQQAIILVPVLFIAAVLVKMLPSFVMKLGFSWRETFGAGMLLSARLSLIIAASAIGLRLGVISDSVNAAIILVAVISVTTAPLLFSKLIPSAVPDKRRPFIVVGAGPIGIQVGEQLRDHHEEVVFVDVHADRITRVQSLGFAGVVGQSSQYDPAVETYLDGAKGLVCVYSDPDRSFRVCDYARKTYGIDPVIARLTAPGDVARFDRIGAKTMNAAMDQATLLVLLARNPAIYELLTRTDDNKEICEITVRNPAFLNKPLRKIPLPADLLVLAVRREGDLVVPHGGTELFDGDQLTVLGSEECAESTRNLLRQAA